MLRLIAALLLLQAVAGGPVVDNEYVRAFKNSAPCATGGASCGARVVVALGSIQVDGRKMERGEVKVFNSGEKYTAPSGGNYLEVAIKPNHPRPPAPAAGSPAPPGNKVLYDGPGFTVFAERMAVGEYGAAHSHNVRLAIFLNDTMVEQWTDGKDETRELIPDTVIWRPAVVHASKDVGKLPISNLLIEFKP